MALVVKDRVKETSVTTGTGSVTLAGAADGFQSFAAALSDGDTTYYAIVDAGTGDFEVGLGTYNAGVLARTTILESSNAGSIVSLQAGEKEVFITYPAEKSVYLDASNNLNVPGLIEGRNLTTDGLKLDGIEANATADQTPSEIKTAYESNANTNAYTDAEKSKLSGIEAGATADQTKADIDALGINAATLQGNNAAYFTGYTDTAIANLVAAAPGTLDTLNELAAALGDDPNFATTVSNSIATKLPLSGGTMTGNITFNSTQLFDGRDVSADGAKLDGIEAGATADQTASEIKTLYESNANTNAYTDAEKSKLGGIEAGATADQTITAGSGLTGGGTGNVTISHADTSAQASVNNSNGVVIQDVTLDTYGHVTGLASIDLDGRYYTESEADSRFVNVTGDTMTGDLVISKADAKIRLYDSTGTSGNNPFIEWDTTATQGIKMELNVYDGELPEAGYGLVVGPSTTNTQWPTTGNLSFNVLGEIYAGSENLSTLNRVFHDGYHPNADKLTTARTITLNGDVSGSTSFDGSGNVTLTATVADDSHNHVWDNIDGASISGLSGPRFTTSSGYIEFGPANTTWAHIYTDRPAFYFNKNLYVNGSQVWHAGNDGSGSGLDADLLDGQHGSYYYSPANAPDPTLTINGDASGSATFTNLGNATLTLTVADNSHNHSISTLTDEHRLFNNMGDNHATRTNFNATYDFGWRYIQGTTNGPNVNGATQYYSLYAGLGNEYSSSQYGMQIAYPRNVSTPYITVRYKENTVWGGWHKISAGYADSAGNADTLDGQHGSYYYPASNPNGYTSNVGDITGVTAGSGISGGGTSGTVTISHADTSAQASVNNSGATVIQDVTLDTYGHVTGLASATLSASTVGALALTGGTVTGTVTIDTGSSSSDALVIRGTSPTINMIDEGSEDDFYIHVNSNNFYVLRDVAGADAVGTGWDSPHPLQLEGDTNVGYLFGNVMWHAGNDGAGSGLDADKLDGQHGSYYAPISNPSFTGLAMVGNNIELDGNSGNIYASYFIGNGSGLTNLPAASAKNDIFWENGQTVTTSYTITNGKNAMSAGPITINSGVTVTVGAGETWTVV